MALELFSNHPIYVKVLLSYFCYCSNREIQISTYEGVQQSVFFISSPADRNRNDNSSNTTQHSPPAL